MVTEVKKMLSGHLRNVRGWRSRRRMVVFESDDWGSVRMPDRATYDLLLTKGVRVDNCPFNSYDSLAREDDLTALFETLRRHRDVNGHYPVVTANCVVANPDFEKIRSCHYQAYHYELFTETLKRYPQCGRSFDLWEQGIQDHIFYPQFHGREHLNVARWMAALQMQLPETLLGFDLNLFGLSKMITSETRASYLEALAVENAAEQRATNAILADGLVLFQGLFGYVSQSFIAPNYVWSSLNEKVLLTHGIKYIQGQRRQILAKGSAGVRRTVGHYTGQRNASGQIYLVRNCYFEPSLNPKMDSTAACLSQIKTAFQWGKPAIIAVHRVNFIGAIDEANRTRNLFQFNKLLASILKTWPGVEFVTSDALGAIIEEPV
jgi:hypothetical protein